MSELEFNASVCAFRDPMYNYAYTLTKNNDDAQDLVQDAILKAFRYKHRFVENQNLKGWLVTILRNTFLNDYNRAKRRPIPASMENADHLMYSRSDYNHGEMNINMEELGSLVSSIDEKFQKPFEMRNRGFKYDEIADKLAIPIGTVKHRIHRCREELKEKVNANYN